ncbi:helix-turn-helix domain-containing protein [Vibrio sp. McD22-P3]|uniref:helix-turn-helix domain-containing protein n=1 Tax=Vibrio sp. McD22-P3 TaxID=2724880 RepID=UPI001F2E4456|nr:helix-turn-helix domain-containing protein [Vibrio sp. McD22-P3]MCF4173565.1 helix-turn-helix domain-containing protein [Vibrio sp. McD22-P3]
MDQQTHFEFRKDNGDLKDEFILAALKSNGWTYSTLGEAHGLGKTTLRNAIRANWPKGEDIIASALGVTADVIWPSRFPRREVKRG